MNFAKFKIEKALPLRSEAKSQAVGKKGSRRFEPQARHSSLGEVVRRASWGLDPLCSPYLRSSP